MLKSKVLYVLEQNKGNIVTGGQLAKALGVSRSAIWKTVHRLKEDGNEIVSVPNIGYKLLHTNDTLSEQIISDMLSTVFIGRSMKLLPSVHSTNQHLKELNMSDIENGYVVIADEQVNGRGRRNRPFISLKGEGVYLSLLLKLGGVQQDIRLLTVCAAAAVSKAIENTCHIKTGIKWVNDIYCNEKKICGILTEAIVSGELQELDAVIIGIGINTGTVPCEISDIATSIKQETGICGIRNYLAAETLNQFEQIYLDYTERDKKPEILKYYENRLFITDRQVLVSSFQNDYIATVLGIDSSGALIVKNEDGDIRHIVTGEIKLM